MNKLSIVIFTVLCLALNMHAFELGDGDKAALLMVHFGSTFDDTRAATIDAINEKAKAEFPDMKVVEAYTSRIIISRLAKRGVVKQNPRQALLQLAAEGYTHVFIQSTNVIDGIEAQSLRSEADYMVPFFKEVRVGNPLLYTIEDCLEVEKILAQRYADQVGKNSAVVLVGPRWTITKSRKSLKFRHFSDFYFLKNRQKMAFLSNLRCTIREQSPQIRFCSPVTAITV